MTIAESDNPTMFEREQATYARRKSELLANEGQYVVIRGDEVLGTYPSATEAFDAGVRAYGPEPFFMHQIVREEKSLFNPFIGSTSRDDGPLSFGYAPL
jgi:hypothetical protein